MSCPLKFTPSLSGSPSPRWRSRQLPGSGTHLSNQLTHSITSKISDLKKRAVIHELVLTELTQGKSPIRRGDGITCQLKDGRTEGFTVPISVCSTSGFPIAAARAPMRLARMGGN